MLKVAPISAKLMEVGNGVVGAMENVKNSRGVEVGYVQPIVAWSKRGKTGEA